MRRSWWVALVVLLAGCGGGGSTGTTASPGVAAPGVPSPTAAQIAQRCPKGASFMGCSTAGAGQAFTSPNFAASGCKIPDVSSWQGHPNWNAAKGAICGAIFKAGEYGSDPDAAYNAQALAALHIWHAIYWFVRNTGCSHEVAQIIAAAHAYHVLVVGNDLETPEAAGYAACLVPAERKAGLIPVDYTAPGTWPGGAGEGNAPLWQAEYGPTLHPFWRPVVAWQCTDGHFGCVTSIPGIGQGDVSVDLGITKLGVPAKPSGPVCFGAQAQHSSTCTQVRQRLYLLGKQRDLFRSYVAVSERNLRSAHGRQRVVIERRLAFEKKKLASLEQELQTQLARYGYHKKG